MKNYKYPKSIIRRLLKELLESPKFLYEERLAYLLGLFSGLMFAGVIKSDTFGRLSHLSMKTRNKIISLR